MRRALPFLLRRLVLLVPLLFVVALGTFVLLRLGGQDPSAMLAGPTATADEIARLRAQYGLDRPLPVQFLIWLGRVLNGDLGHSWISNRPVLAELVDRAPASLELLVLGVLIGALVGVPVGLISALRRGRGFDHAARLISLLGFSVPTYFLGLALLLIFFYVLEWAPPGMGRLSLMLDPPPRVTGSFLLDALFAGRWETAQSAAAQLVLPVASIAILCAAPIIAQTRAIALSVLSSPPIAYAEAQGLPPRTIARIALRNAATPVVTFIGAELVGLVGSGSLIEYVFAWGGTGQFGLDAIVKGDFAVVQGYVLLLAVFSVVVFLAVDLLVLVLEPRAGRA
ncbi:MAG: ABC transporter permease [Rhodospirillales bacterium]|nr:ABC transporter permease [Rhodospirillales bacterium]